MRRFDHERLEVYHVGLDFVALAERLVQGIPRRSPHLADQLRRAATSICLNIAEGAGEFSPLEKARFYRMTLRAATECAAVLDILRRLRAGSDEHLAAGRELLLRVVSMLTKLAQRGARVPHAHP